MHKRSSIRLWTWRNNEKRERLHFEKAPTNLIAVIFIPKNRKRGNNMFLQILKIITNKKIKIRRFYN